MQLTPLLITTGLIALAVYDGIVVYIVPMCTKGKPCVDRSVSRFFQMLPVKSPFVLIVIGFCMGHFFGFMPCPPCPDTEVITEETHYPPTPVLKREHP